MSARAMFLALALALGVCSGGGQSAYPLSGPGMTDIAGGGSWDGDLGVPLVCNGSPGATWVMLGDVLGSVQHRRVPNAMGLLTEFDQFRMIWSEDSDGLARQFSPLLAQSTVPAGAVYDVSRDVPYVFMMNVLDWGSGAPGSVHAQGMLVSGTEGCSDGKNVPSFNNGPLWIAPQDAILVNAAPLLSSDGYVYVFATALYRASAIYLARVPVGSMGNLGAYAYWQSGGGWGHASSAGVVITGSVGELSAMWLGAPGGPVTVCYCDYDGLLIAGPWLVCQTAAHPTAPFGNYTVVMTNSYQPWYQDPSWTGIYGGYLVGGWNAAGVPSTKLLVSVWVPYRVFALDW